MNKHCYLQLTQSFALQNTNYRNGVNVFSPSQTLAGTWVISSNALNEFPELFEGRSSFNILFLSTIDFPQLEINL